MVNMYNFGVTPLSGNLQLGYTLFMLPGYDMVMNH